MGRTFVRESPTRTVAVADSAFPANQPAAPATFSVEVAPLPAGVFRTEGANVLLVDISQTSSASANCTYNVLAWNRIQGLWFSVLIVLPPGAGTQTFRTSIPNWASDYAFVVVAGTTVAASISVLSAEVLTE